MFLFGLITARPASPVVQVVIVAAGLVALFVLVKIGGVILKVVLGLAGVGIVWWFFAKMIH